MFETVNAIALDVVPAFCAGNVSIVGATIACGCPAVHVRLATLSPPESESLANVTIDVCEPVTPAGGEQMTPTCAGVVTERLRLQLCPTQPSVPSGTNVNQVPAGSITALNTASGPLFVIVVF